MLLESMAITTSPGFVRMTNAAADSYMAHIRQKIADAQNSPSWQAAALRLDEANALLLKQVEAQNQELAEMKSLAASTDRTLNYARATQAGTKAVLGFAIRCHEAGQDLTRMSLRLTSHAKKDGSLMTIREYVYDCAFVNFLLSEGYTRENINTNYLSTGDIYSLEKVQPVYEEFSTELVKVSKLSPITA